MEHNNIKNKNKMKKLITILAIAAITFSAQSQIIVNGNDISNEPIIVNFNSAQRAEYR